MLGRKFAGRLPIEIGDTAQRGRAATKGRQALK